MLDAWALDNARLKKRIAAACFQRRHLQRAACLHALCNSEAKAIRSYGLTNPICVIPNGVDLPESPVTDPPPWCGEAVANRKVILFLGRLHPKKGLRHLLEGWHALLSERAGVRESWCVVIAGWDEGGHRAELEDQAASLAIADTVFFVGPVQGKEKAAAFAHADAFILPSFSEGLPMAILEAWSYGLPVGATRECNLPEGPDAGAAIAMSADAAGARACLESMTSLSADERITMGEKGRRLVREQFTWDVVSREMFNVYEWLCNSASRPDCVHLPKTVLIRQSTKDGGAGVPAEA